MSLLRKLWTQPPSQSQPECHSAIHVSPACTAFLNLPHSRHHILPSVSPSHWRKNRFVDTVTIQETGLFNLRSHYRVKLRICCGEGCCCWSAFFVQSELVSIIRSHNGLGHVRGWQKIAELQEVFGFWSNTFFWALFWDAHKFDCKEHCSHLPVIVPQLNGGSGAGWRVRMCTCWEMAWSGIPSGALLLPSSQLKAVPTLGRQGGGVSRGGAQGDFIILCLTWQLCLVSRGIWNSNGQLSILLISCILAAHRRQPATLQGPPRREWSSNWGHLVPQNHLESPLNCST